MTDAANRIVQKLWSYCHVLHDDGLSSRWAFEGRLVGQDPTDEPASALLERIRAERPSADTGR